MRDRFAHDLIGLQSPTDEAYFSRDVDTETPADVLVMKVMRAVAHAMREDADLGPRILDELDIAGVDRWGDSAVVIRCRFRCQPLEQWGIRREYLRRLKTAFDEAGIEIPYPHLTVYAGQDRNGKAPAFGIRQMATP